jgi:hypothetical protein
MICQQTFDTAAYLQLSLCQIGTCIATGTHGWMTHHHAACKHIPGVIIVMCNQRRCCMHYLVPSSKHVTHRQNTQRSRLSGCSPAACAGCTLAGTPGMTAGCRQQAQQQIPQYGKQPVKAVVMLVACLVSCMLRCRLQAAAAAQHAASMLAEAGRRNTL